VAEITEGLATSRSFAVFVGSDPLNSWTREEVNAAVAHTVDDRSFRVFTVMLPSAPRDLDPTDVHSLLGRRTWVDLRQVSDAEESARLLANAVRGEPLGFPARSVELSAFPRTLTRTGWRVHRRHASPEFYFRGPSRFVPEALDAVGVLYLATGPFGALAEIVDPGSVVSSALLEERQLTELDLSGIQLADLGAPEARRFGMAIEVITSPDYSVSQRWASALATAGFDGLVYPSQNVNGSGLVAVFGQEGERSNLRIVEQRRITSADLHAFGVVEAEAPLGSGLEIYER
jgi:hypothetical protein